ncbi:uncharacterized protein IL334_007647 [Kwoniella shivajii]|uniref:Protein CPL1-like domain-containing protein n=1 Tax=Kwoniella shivajii TaxID=564305 RepID=A0ABZ1DB30_9TREE|nr:hypothetical protein IL334_007647 [Kwoniella shivajii]
MIVPVILAAALLVRSAHASAYLGCIDPAAIPSPSGSTTGTDLGDCISYCSSASAAYAYYDNSDGACTCSTSDPAVSAYENAQDSGGTCASDQASVHFLNTDYAFSSCSSTITSEGTARTVFVTTPAQCFTSCAGTYGSAGISHYGSTYVCFCAQVNHADDSQVCQGATGDGGIYIYNRDVVTPTAVARRQLKERLRRALATKHQYCPSGLTACIVGTDPEAFECVDTQADLESCGGCMNGLYGPTVRNGTFPGVDCSTLPAVAMGGVTCTRGQCEVSACSYGHALVDNQCVRMVQ